MNIFLGIFIFDSTNMKIIIAKSSNNINILSWLNSLNLSPIANEQINTKMNSTVKTISCEIRTENNDFFIVFDMNILFTIIKDPKIENSFSGFGINLEQI